MCSVPQPKRIARPPIAWTILATAGLVVILLAAVTFPAGSAPSTEPQKREPLFTFVQISDVHVGNEANLPAHTRLKAAVSLINALEPDFVIDTGDMTSSPVYAATEENFAEYAEYKKYIAPLTVPIYFVPGNHDIGYFDSEKNPRGRTWGEYKALVQRFERELGPLNQSFTHKGARFVLINNNPPCSRWPGHVSREQLAWIEQELRKGEVAFLFAHVQVLEEGKGAPWGSSGEALATLCDTYDVAMFAYGHAHDSVRVDRNGTLYNMCPDLKTPGHQSIFLYKLFEDEFELWSYDVLSRSGSLLGAFPLPRMLVQPTAADP